MSGFISLNNSTSKRVLNLLEPVKLTVLKVMIQRVTVVKFRVNYGGGNGAGCFEVKVRADTGGYIYGEREPITRVPAGSRGRAPGQEVRVAKPPPPCS